MIRYLAARAECIGNIKDAKKKKLQMLWWRHPSSWLSDLVFARARIKLHFALSSISLYFLTGMIKIPRVCQKNFPIGWFLAAARQHATTLLFFLTLCRLIKMLGLAWCLLPCDLLDIPHTNTRAHLSSSSLRRFSPALFAAASSRSFIFCNRIPYTHHAADSPLFSFSPKPKGCIHSFASKFPNRRLNKSLPVQATPRPQC